MSGRTPGKTAQKLLTFQNVLLSSRLKAFGLNLAAFGPSLGIATYNPCMPAFSQARYEGQYQAKSSASGC